MINFEEELKKFHPNLEIEEAEDAINSRDLTDAADLLLKMLKGSASGGTSMKYTESLSQQGSSGYEG